MTTRSKGKFAELLTDAVYQIKLRRHWTISGVQDELGQGLGRQGGSTIEYWRKGNVPANTTDLEQLARAIIEQCQFDRTWLESFLFHGHHDNPAEFCNVIFLGQPTTPTKQTGPMLPRKFYRTLIGREGHVDKIGNALRDPDCCWLITIDGLGGIGKTAIALDVASQFQQEDYFESVLWFSAAASGRLGATINGSQLTFETVLDFIGLQLGDNEFTQLERAEKIQRVAAYLRHHRILIILDNLETAAEPQDDIVDQLQPLLNPSKAVLTSRDRFKVDAFQIHLEGLSSVAAERFMRQDAVEKGIQRVESARPEDLELINMATGGSPLALKLVVSQLGHWDLPIALHHLRQATPIGRVAAKDEYVRFYKHIFERSWSLLTNDDELLLIAMAHFDPDEGSNWSLLSQTSNLATDILTTSLDALWQLSLLEVAEVSSLQQIRYYLHPLTQYFVLADMIKVL